MSNNTPAENTGRKTEELTGERLADVAGGATAIQYGLIAAGISTAIIATVNQLGGDLKNKFDTVKTALG